MTKTRALERGKLQWREVAAEQDDDCRCRQGAKAPPSIFSPDVYLGGQQARNLSLGRNASLGGAMVRFVGVGNRRAGGLV